jgi:prepilin-type processing-associated H-X9-DG protein
MSCGHQTRARVAFTLIELLVVVSLITLLIAILLPALREARQAAYASQCLSNVRQLAIGAYAYTQDEKDQLLMSRYTGHSTTTASPYTGVTVLPGYGGARWLDILWGSYLNKNFAVLECPMQTDLRGPSTQVAAPYSPRSMMPGYLVTWHAAHYGGGTSTWGIRPSKHSVFRNQSNKIWYADSGERSNVSLTAITASYVTHFRDLQGANQGYHGGISRRHKDGSNVAMFDGSAKQLPWKEAGISYQPNTGGGVSVGDHLRWARYWSPINGTSWSLP